MCVHTRVCVYLCVCMGVWIYVFVNKCVGMILFAYVFLCDVCVCVCVCECVYTGISVRVCVHACVHVCLCVDLHKPCIFMCARVAVTIPRVSFPEQDQSEKFESRIPVKYRAWRAPDFHSQALSSFVHIEWTMVSLTVAAYMSGRLGCFLVAVCGCLALLARHIMKSMF